MKSLAKSILISLLILLGKGTSSLGVVSFESLESQTVHLTPVYNEIHFEQKGSQDIWTMLQSHRGPHLPKTDWDSISIVVEGGIASFYQLPQGTTRWSEEVRPIPYKAKCLLCHANGPRAIRPNPNSNDVILSWKEKLQIAFWNLRIKSYGRLKNIGDPRYGNIQFQDKLAQEPLQIKSCTRCHKESGFFARGTLTRQHFMPIQFMLSKGLMPPLGLSISQKEKEGVLKFIGAKP